MRLDPNTHAFVAATALLTAGAFTIFVLNLLALWVPDESVRRWILVDTPATLYGF